MINVTINTDVLEKIVFSPQDILADEEAFWQQRSQKLTLKWSDMVNYTISFEEWREQIRQWAELQLSERVSHSLFKNGQELVAGKDDFLQKALPHIASYLPDGADVSVTIHLTAFIPARAFAVEDIVINVDAPYWKDNVDNIWNTMVHEIFHAGYGYFRDLQVEDRPVSETIYRMLDNMFNEGVCTYVAFQALSLFPAPDEKDYQLLACEADVRRLLQDASETLAQADSLDGPALKQLVMEKCIMGRAYYVTGAHMCQAIDHRLGREALIKVLLQGPVSFVRLYNTLAKPEMKIQLEYSSSAGLMC